MDTQYDIQWMQHHAADIKVVDELIIQEEEDQASEDGEEYGVTADVDAANIDQIAAENLIFMARDGQMVSEIIATASGDINMKQANEYVYDAESEYADTTPQMVTEEVITDDWVQRQGAERVEIPAEQIIGSGSQVVLDIEVPLPTVQDEYTALRPYPCDFCSRRFRKKTSLMNHMVAHQSDRPNLCKLCGSRFFRRSDLISHLKAHADAPDVSEEPGQEDLATFESQMEHQTNLDHSSINDHYYDYDSYDLETNRNDQRGDLTKLTNGNSNSSPAPTVRTGRISRLKPKRETFNIESTVEVNQPEAKEQAQDINCPDLQASSAVVKFVHDTPTQHQVFPIIDDNKPFVCQQCGLAFAREKALSAHVKNHRNESPYECDQCNEMFWDKESLTEHQRSHQFEASNSEYDPEEVEDETLTDSEAEVLYGEFYCNQCGMSFHRHDLLTRHSKTHEQSRDAAELFEKGGQHSCNTCGETFEEALDLLAHAEIHARYPPFKCNLCGESFFEEQTIRRHLLNQHANAMTVNSCILCGKECRDRKALIKHAWDHSREKCHSCSKCGKSFHNKARLKRHMTSHRDKSVICNICFEEFPDGRTLSNHRHSHSTTSAGKLFPCNECGKTFGSRSSQQIHVRIHTGEKPYGCRYCWKAFADGGTLRKHERIHTGEKPYVCSVCSRAFNQRVVLREHIRSHHSGLDMKRGTFFCPVCQENSTSSADLVQHLIQHSDVNTAKQRRPITGPRKYKRRRKLKPHEIERMRGEPQVNSEHNESDVDITDIDMENVDDLLAMTEGSTQLVNNKRSKATTSRTTTMKRSIKPGSNRSKSSTTTTDDYNDLDETSSSSRTRYNPIVNNSEKLWSSKLRNNLGNANDESLLLNVENTLQSIDTLVVGTDNESKQSTPNKKAGRMTNTTPDYLETSARGRRRAPNNSKQTTRPRMIHTEKSSNNLTNNNIDSHNKQRCGRTNATTTRMLLARNEPSTTISNSLDLLPSSKTSLAIDDYEIISPATQPPHQISSSPIHIKQEEHEHLQQQQRYQQYQLQQFQQHQQQLMQETNNEQRRRRRYLFSQSSQTSRSSDLYDAQLLLDAATLRKDCYEKFNPSIVNDLEEILRSPLKNDKMGERLRNTSECSTTTQYLGDQSEEVAALIKLEPTSPDFQSLFNCTNATNSANAKTPERSTRSSRNRQVTPNRRYLEFETTSNSSAHASGRQGSAKQKKNTTATEITEKAGGSERSYRKSLRSNSINVGETSKTNLTTTTAYHHHNNRNMGNVNTTGASELDSSYDAMSTIDSATAAVHAAETAAANSKLQATEKRSKYYFECEMCSMVFTDRAQLLDHVPIHI